MGKPRKRRNSGRSKKEKLNSVISIPSSKANEGVGCNLDRIGQLMTDLIMWNDVAKSSLWFGFGSLCFLTSCFVSGVSFRAFSMISQLGLLFSFSVTVSFNWAFWFNFSVIVSLSSVPANNTEECNVASVV